MVCVYVHAVDNATYVVGHQQHQRTNGEREYRCLSRWLCGCSAHISSSRSRSVPKRCRDHGYCYCWWACSDPGTLEHMRMVGETKAAPLAQHPVVVVVVVVVVAPPVLVAIVTATAAVQFLYCVALVQWMPSPLV